MRKIKVFVVSVLTVLLAMFCLAGCGETGKYALTSCKVASAEINISENDSYVELKSENVAVVSIDLAVGKLEGEGTWKKGAEKGAVVITLDGVDYNMTVADGNLTFEIFRAVLTFTKE